MLKNTAGQVVGAQMVSASDGSPFTGTVTASVTVDGGTQAPGSVGSGLCTHEGNGYHTYTPSQAETNGDLLAFTFTGTGAIPATVQVYTRDGDAFTRIGVDGAGLTALGDTRLANLDATVSSRLATAGYTAPLDAAGVRAAVGLASANLDAQLAAIDDYVDTEIADILVDTSTTLDDLVDDLEARLSAALADKLAAHAAGVLKLVIGTGSTTTSIVLSTVEGAGPSATNDFYNGAVLIITSGALAGQRTDVTDYDGATGTLTVTALTGSPANGVTALLV